MVLPEESTCYGWKQTPLPPRPESRGRPGLSCCPPTHEGPISINAYI